MSATSRFVSQYVTPALAGLAVVPSMPAPRPAVVVATHDGKFHCDESLAVGLLRTTQGFAGATVIRTRKPDLIDAADCVVDVGAVYDPSKHRYDHHQLSFTGTMHTGAKQYDTRLSSAGLVYKHFGREVIARYMAHCLAAGRLAAPFPDPQAAVEAIFDKIYSKFIEAVDGNDNGRAQFTGEKQYSESTSLPSRVSSLFPRWNEPSSPAAENEMFAEAVRLATQEFFEALDYYLCAWLQGRSIVEATFKQRASVHPSGRIMAFVAGGPVPPWKDSLYEIEREQQAVGQVLYVLFPEGGGKGWRVMCVSKEEQGFQNRKDLLHKGLRDKELDAALGVPEGSMVFCHASGFIGGAMTREHALLFAVKSLEAPAAGADAAQK